MHRTFIDTPILNRLLPLLGRAFLRVMRWRPGGEAPTMAKCVLIAAPHTSNWDFPITLALAVVFRVKLYWIGKKSIFRWPFGRFFRWLGGIPIDRGRAGTVVMQAVRAFKNSESLVIAMAPEGTRGKVNVWKKGFYAIATAAEVPIVMGFLDYGRKVGGFGPTLMPTGDIDADMATIREFYSGVTAKYPEKTGLAQVREES